MTVDEVKQAVAIIPSFITDDDIACYYKYANLIDDNSIIFDLGTGWGKSMVALALSNPTNVINSCDTGSYPIGQGWAENEFHYENKIKKLIRDFNLNNAIFYREAAEILVQQSLPQIDLLHIDNWVEINQIDSSKFLKDWIAKVKKGGYILMRNYGYGDRQPFTNSVDKATEGLQRVDTMGLITIWQK